MADSKITALTAISTVDPTADPLVIVDVSDTSMAASGTTKKSTINQLLGAGGTATLASATITGDLTVDTSTLKVDSANNRVGIGTASPAYLLDIADASFATRFVATNTNNSAFGAGVYLKTLNGASMVSNATLATSNDGTFNLLTGTSADSTKLSIGPTGIFTFQNVGGVAGTAMTLNATGLGVGGSPTAKISCAGYSSANQLPDINIARSSSGTAIQTGPNIVFTDGTSNNTVTLQNSQGRFGIWNYGAGSWNERLSVDANGNCGIGVTPSALSGFGTTLRQKGVGAAGGIFTENNTGASWFGIYSGTSTSDAAAVTFTDGGSLRFAKTTAVGVTGFTELLRLKNGGQLRFVPLAADPAGAEAGDVYYNSTSNKLKCYNGTTWNDLF